MTTSVTAIVCAGVGFTRPDGETVFTDLTTTFGAGRSAGRHPRRLPGCAGVASHDLAFLRELASSAGSRSTAR